MQADASRSFSLLKSRPSHPSLRFKKIGKLWSARVGRAYRAFAVEDGADLIWVWIGRHDEDERLIDKWETNAARGSSALVRSGLDNYFRNQP